MTLTTSDAMKVMVAVQACHPRTASRMDDPEVTLATASVWADMFNAYGLTVPDLVAGVKQRAQQRPEAPEPAEIIEAARAIRRDRTERESDDERKAREDAWDKELMALNRERLEELVAAPIGDVDAKFTRPSQRHDAKPNPLAVRCPWCHAPEFRPCHIPNTGGEFVTLREPHPSRVEAVTPKGETA